ncbi:hypothetical protein TKK_0005372 [Trichogramma kaykai]
MDETVIVPSYPSHCDWIISEYIVRKNRSLGGSSIISPTFLCTRKREWNLELFLNSSAYSSSLIGIKLKRKGPPETLDYGGSYIYILNSIGKESAARITVIHETNINYFNNVYSSTFFNQLSKYLFNGQLTIRFLINACPVTLTPSLLSFECSPISLANLLDNPDLSDIQLIVNDVTFYAHKVILASRSTVFATMFKKEIKDNIVRIRDLSVPAIKQMLNFIYVNKVDVDDNTVNDILKASHKYKIKELKNLCGQYLIRKLTVQNCIDIIQIAHKFDMRELKFSAMNLIVSKSDQICETKEFYKLAQKNSNLHTVIVTYVLSELDQLENELLKSDAMIYKYDRFVHQNIVFKHTKGGSKPFYKWKYNEHKNNIEKLLHGHRVTLKADIKQGFKGNAVKFNKIGINFASSNKTIKQKLVKLLSGFSVTLIHLGHSFYRCDDRIYMIPSDNQAIIYSMTHHPESNVPVTTNKVYDKIAKNEPVLSLYATWQIQLNGDKDRFDELSKYANETIDLVLEGKGQYVDLNLPVVCNKQLDQYYSRSNNQMNTIQIYEKLPESDLTKVEKWIDELLLGIVSTV